MSEQKKKEIMKCVELVYSITERGNSAEIKRKKDGTLAVYEVQKKIPAR